MNKDLSIEDLNKIELLSEPYKTIIKDALESNVAHLDTYENVISYLKQYVFNIFKDMCLTFDPDSKECCASEKFYDTIVQTIANNHFNIVDFSISINDKDRDTQKIRVNNEVLHISIPFTLYLSEQDQRVSID